MFVHIICGALAFLLFNPLFEALRHLNQFKYEYVNKVTHCFYRKVNSKKVLHGFTKVTHLGSLNHSVCNQ